jgi:hypothetical protein
VPRKKIKSATLSLFPQLDEPVVSVKAKRIKQATVKAKPDEDKKRGGAFQSATDLLSRYQQLETNKHISHEFQSFGCHIAAALDDKAHTSLYIKLAKRLPRQLLERGLSFVSDANADNKAKLFMWKIKQLQADKPTELK